MGSLRKGIEIKYFTEDGIIYGQYADTQDTFIVGGDPLALAEKRSSTLTEIEFNELIKLSKTSRHAEFTLNQFTGMAREILKEANGK